jgi:hypothetical protein
LYGAIIDVGRKCGETVTRCLLARRKRLNAEVGEDAEKAKEEEGSLALFGMTVVVGSGDL